MKAFVLFAMVLIIGYRSYAQKPLPEFADFTAEEYSLSKCAFDKSADAVILFDEGFTINGRNNALETYRRLRIKILTTRGIGRSDITIPFISKDNYETITEIKAVSCTMNESGEYIKTYIQEKEVFTNKLDELTSEVKLAIPNIKPGTIIEYVYLRTTATVTGIRDWFFQSDLPTLKSRYSLRIPGYTEVTYKVEHYNDLPVTIKRKTMEETVFFEMQNIPAFIPEPFMDAPENYLQKVKFIVSGYITLTGQRSSVMQNWTEAGQDFAAELVYRRVFGSDINADEELKKIARDHPVVKDRLEAVYNYVKSGFIWNGYYGLLPSESLKKVWESRKGNAGEINLLLLYLLKWLDIPASPLLVAERDYGRVDSTYPSFNYFNKTVVYTELEGKKYILDASGKYNNLETIPYQLLNTYALLIDRKKPVFFRITSQGQAYKKQVFIEGELNNQGIWKGTAWLNFEEYAGIREDEYLNTHRPDEARSTMEELYEGLAIDSFSWKTPAGNERHSVSEKLTFTIRPDLANQFAFINTNLFTGFRKNPFIAENRVSGINFGYPYVVNIQIEIRLPEGTEAEKIPEDKVIVTGQRNMSIARIIKKEAGKLFVKYIFTQSQTYYETEEYEAVKTFYTRMLDLVNEPVVLKLN